MDYLRVVLFSFVSVISWCFSGTRLVSLKEVTIYNTVLIGRRGPTSGSSWSPVLEVDWNLRG
jgi:hypothetical protein